MPSNIDSAETQLQGQRQSDSTELSSARLKIDELDQRLEASEEARLQLEQLIRESLHQSSSVEQQLAASDAAKVTAEKDLTNLKKELVTIEIERASLIAQVGAPQQRVSSRRESSAEQRMVSEGAGELEKTKEMRECERAESEELRRVLNQTHNRDCTAQQPQSRGGDEGTQEAIASLMHQLTTTVEDKEELEATVAALTARLAATGQSRLDGAPSEECWGTAEDAGMFGGVIETLEAWSPKHFMPGAVDTPQQGNTENQPEPVREARIRAEEAVQQATELRDLLGSAKQMIVNLKTQLGSELDRVSTLQRELSESDKELSEMQMHEITLQSEIQELQEQVPSTVQALLEEQIVKLNTKMAVMSQELEESEERELLLEKRVAEFDSEADFSRDLRETAWRSLLEE